MPALNVKHKTVQGRSGPFCARWPDHMQLQVTNSGLVWVEGEEMQWGLGLRTTPTFMRSGGRRFPRSQAAMGAWPFPGFSWETHIIAYFVVCKLGW